MKLLIVICLVAAAFAAPSVRLRRTILPGDARYNPVHHQVGDVHQHHQNEFNTARALEGCGSGLVGQAPAPAPATPVESSPVQEQQAVAHDTPSHDATSAEQQVAQAAVESSAVEAEKVQAVGERTFVQAEADVAPVPAAVQPEQQYAVKTAEAVETPVEHSHVHEVAEKPEPVENVRTAPVSAEQSQYPVPVEQSQYPAPVEQSQYPVPVEQSQHSVSAEQTQVPVNAEQTQAVVAVEQSQVEQAAVAQNEHVSKGKAGAVQEHEPVAAEQQVPTPVQPQQYEKSVPEFQTKSTQVEQAHHHENQAVAPEAHKSPAVDSGVAKAKALEAEPAKPYTGPGSATFDAKHQTPVAPYHPAVGAYTPGLNAWDHARYNPGYNAAYPGYAGYTGAYNGQWNNNYGKLGWNGAYPTGAYPGTYTGAYPGTYLGGATPYTGAYNPVYKGKTVIDPHAPLAPFPHHPEASNYLQNRALGYPGYNPYHFPAPVVPVVPAVAHKEFNAQKVE